MRWLFPPPFETVPRRHVLGARALLLTLGQRLPAAVAVGAVAANGDGG